MHPHTVTHRGYRIRISDGPVLPIQRRPLLFAAAHIFAWGLWLLYVTAQLRLVRSVRANSPSQSFLRVYMALFAEFALSFQDLAEAFSAIFIMFLSRATPRVRLHYELLGSAAPSVDVFVACCGEPVDVLKDTLAGAVDQDYPSERLRVFVLDDGKSEELARAVEELARKSRINGGATIKYLSRRLKPGQHSFYKAGNLQYGIEESNKVDGGEFIGSLDADMIPERDWLKKVIPHLLVEDKLGMVSAPQRYYNVPDSDPFGSETALDVNVTFNQTLNDQIDAASCLGSGFIVRRRALESIGGWPMADTGEDAMCSCALVNAGWRIALIQEQVQLGLAPDTLAAHAKQRIRWNASAFPVHAAFGWYLWSTDTTALGMTLQQRVGGLLTVLRDLSPPFVLSAMLLLPLAVFPTTNTVAGTDAFAQVAHADGRATVLVLFLAAYAARKAYDHIVFGHIGVGRMQAFRSNNVWLAPQFAFRTLAAFLPPSLSKLKFEATGAAAGAVHERSAAHRAPLLARLRVPLVLTSLLYCAYATLPLLLLAGSYLLHNAVLRTAEVVDVIPLFALPGALLALVDVLGKAAVPVRYMVAPPAGLQRRELMDVDAGTGVARPKRRFVADREREGWGVGVLEVVVEVGIIYACLMG